MRNIIGISAFYHDAACCLLQNGRLVAAAQEERFTRIKHDPALPFHAFMYCLEAGDIDITDIDLLAFYEDPVKKTERQLSYCRDEYLLDKIRTENNKESILQRLREGLGYQGPVSFVDHHRSHAASSFYFSGFPEAAIFTVDGVGEWATTTYATGGDKGIDIFEEVLFPDSLGLLYSALTHFLGFEVNEGEYKVMGLAPYGTPVFRDKIEQLVINGHAGSYRLDAKYFDFSQPHRMYTDELSTLLGIPPRLPGTLLSQQHKDVARSLQLVLEEIMLEKVRYLHRKTGMENLCLAGGVALNCVVNGRIAAEGPFRNVFIQPAANDAGGAIGAAAEVYFTGTGKRLTDKPLPGVFLGPGYTDEFIEQALSATNIRFRRFSGRQDMLLRLVASRLNNGKIIGWFQGRMEFGPRSLGARSILADPRVPGMREKVNAAVKKREGFRPFAPAVLAEKAPLHFDLKHTSPFMLETCQVISPISLPAITHVDNSARVQTVDPAENQELGPLLSAFDALTGCPVLLNTSFNIKDEPIVCSPYDAISCFVVSGLDCLVLGDFLIDRDQHSLEILRVILEAGYIRKAGISHNIYSFL